MSVTPGNAPEAWREAARATQERLQSVAASSDCGAIGIEVAGDRAFVAFTTRDGRQAVRALRSPDEIGPLVDALLVTLPAQPPEPATAEAPVAATSSAPVDRVDHPPTPTTDPPVRVVLRADGGGRVGSPGGFTSPSVSAGAGTIIRAWELAVFGQWDPTAYVLTPGETPRGFAMSRYAVGVAAGRRAALGPVSFVFGLSTAIAVTNESSADTNEQSTGGQSVGNQATGGLTGNGQSASAEGRRSTAEPLAGAYVGVVYPRRSPLRLRSELSAEAVASRIGRSLSLDPSLPSLPWWSASASIGVEWVVP